MNPASSHRIWPTLWLGETFFEATDGTWKSVRHTQRRRALMTPKRVSSLKLPSGVECTGLRRTVVHPVDCVRPGNPLNTMSGASNSVEVEASDFETASDATDPDMPTLEPLVVPAAKSARAVLADLSDQPQGKHRVAPRRHARLASEDQPTIFAHEEQGHKRRTQQRCESTPHG